MRPRCYRWLSAIPTWTAYPRGVTALLPAYSVTRRVLCELCPSEPCVKRTSNRYRDAAVMKRMQRGVEAPRWVTIYREGSSLLRTLCAEPRPRDIRRCWSPRPAGSSDSPPSLRPPTSHFLETCVQMPRAGLEPELPWGTRFLSSVQELRRESPVFVSQQDSWVRDSLTSALVRSGGRSGDRR
jgi:hypothetical protein